MPKLHPPTPREHADQALWVEGRDWAIANTAELVAGLKRDLGAYKEALADARCQLGAVTMKARECATCGAVIDTGEGRIGLAFAIAELEELAYATSEPGTRQRLLCAMRLLDAERAAIVEKEAFR